jgi:hypothetical protein
MTTSSIFDIHEHEVPASHIREYPRALVDDQEDVLRIAVKQYVPKNGHPGNHLGVTIIGAHANGFPKVRLAIAFGAYPA